MLEADPFQPIEILSPVEFILVGTHSNRRAVLVKSVDSKIDLMAYAARKWRKETVSKYVPFISFIPLPAGLKSSPLAVDTQPVSDLLRDSPLSSRISEYTLVWRGASSERMIKRIGQELSLHVYDLQNGLENYSRQNVEWSLASTIDLCNSATLEIERRRVSRLASFWFFLAIYMIALVTMFAQLPFAELMHQLFRSRGGSG